MDGVSGVGESHGHKHKHKHHHNPLGGQQQAQNVNGIDPTANQAQNAGVGQIADATFGNKDV